MPACATADFNGADQRGAGFFQTTTHRRRRWSAADAYLRPALSRPNLTVRTGVLGERVLIEHGRARGALSRPDAAGADTEVGTTDALAANEVIVCAGSICSPHVLLRSGSAGEPPTNLGCRWLSTFPASGRTCRITPRCR